jgi:hypothetical protein
MMRRFPLRYRNDITCLTCILYIDKNASVLLQTQVILAQTATGWISSRVRWAIAKPTTLAPTISGPISTPNSASAIIAATAMTRTEQKVAENRQQRVLPRRRRTDDQEGPNAVFESYFDNPVRTAGVGRPGRSKQMLDRAPARGDGRRRDLPISRAGPRSTTSCGRSDRHCIR